jgi:hypothetical protein
MTLHTRAVTLGIALLCNVSMYNHTEPSRHRGGVVCVQRMQPRATQWRASSGTHRTQLPLCGCMVAPPAAPAPSPPPLTTQHSTTVPSASPASAGGRWPCFQLSSSSRAPHSCAQKGAAATTHAGTWLAMQSAADSCGSTRSRQGWEGGGSRGSDARGQCPVAGAGAEPADKPDQGAGCHTAG